MSLFNVFVYCGGKCASSTLCHTFTNNCLANIQVHTNKYYKHINNTENTIFDIIEASCKKYEAVYIIDSYRLPIERKISSFFQNIEFFLPNYNNLTIQELIEFFNDTLIYGIEEYHSINEVLEYFGLPLFTVFNFEKRYNMITQDNKIFIKILFKDIKKWDIILSEIFQKNIIMVNSNLTKDKEINGIYIQFKEQYKVPKKYITNFLVNDSEFKIYNTESQQKEYIEKWLEKSY